METTEYSAAPPNAYEPQDWREVPKGFYALPFWDWEKFGDDVTPDGPDAVAELIGYLLVVRKVPRTFITGKTVGRDELVIGQQVIAEGVTEYVVPFRESDGTRNDLRYTPRERLSREIDSDRYVAKHDGPARNGEPPLPLSRLHQAEGACRSPRPGA
jgi:hypothetical protein